MCNTMFYKIYYKILTLKVHHYIFDQRGHHQVLKLLLCDETAVFVIAYVVNIEVPLMNV
jgi:NRPS condensation-like uncharacterized protein